MLSIITPTMDRPEMVGRSLRYYQEQAFDGFIIIGDSSRTPNKGIVSDLVSHYSNLGLKIIYEYLPKADYPTVGSCFRRLTELTPTPYTTYAGDDDLHIVPSVRHCLEFLEQNPDYTGVRAHRLEIRFGRPGVSGVIRETKIAPYPDYDRASAAERLAAYAGSGISLQYCIMRTPVWRNANLSIPERVLPYVSEELWPCCLIATAGRIKTLPILGTVMQTDGSGSVFDRTSMYHLVCDPLWPDLVGKLKSKLQTDVAALDGIDKTAAGKAVDMALWRHITMLMAAHHSKWSSPEGSPPPDILSDPDLFARLQKHWEFVAIQSRFAVPVSLASLPGKPAAGEPDRNALFDLGRTALAEGRLLEAKACLIRAAQFDPAAPEPCVLLAEAYRALNWLGEEEAAVREAEARLRRAPAPHLEARLNAHAADLDRRLEAALREAAATEKIWAVAHETLSAFLADRSRWADYGELHASPAACASSPGEALYAMARGRLLSGDVDGAVGLFTRYALEHDPVAAALLPPPGVSPRTLGKAADQENIRRRFETRWEAWRRGETGRPRHAASRTADQAGALCERFRGMKALICASRYINNDPAYVESECPDMLMASARQAGLEPEFYAGDAILYPQFGQHRPPALRERAVEEFRETVERLRPEIVLFDGSFIGADTFLNRKVVQSLRETAGASFFAYLHDSYGSAWERAEYWTPEVAGTLIFDPASIPASTPLHPKLIPTPLPIAATFTAPKDAVRDKFLAFSGDRRKYLREFWLAFASSSGVPFSFRMHERRDPNEYSLASYIKMLFSSKVVLNFTRRSPTFSISTGRIFEGICSGNVVLEEACAATNEFFSPFVHYVPFANVEELASYSNFLFDNEEYRKAIAEMGQDWIREHFSSAHFWALILEKMAR